MKLILSKIGQFFTELLRWVVIALFFIIVFRLSKTIIEPLFTDEIMLKTFNQMLNLALFGGILTGIKKLQSLLILFILALSLFALIVLDKYVVKLAQKVLNFFRIYGEERI